MAAAEPSSFEYTPCPLQFYDFRHLDHLKNCVAYSATLNRKDTLTVDELETLHADLSLMREHVQKRIGLLTSEMGVLNEWQVKREYKRKHDTSDGSQQSGSGRPSKPHPHNTGSPHDGFPPVSKRMKTASGHTEEHGGGGGGVAKISKKKGGGGGGGGKSKVGPPTEPPLEDLQPSVDGSVPILKPDVTDRFWSTIEPYCADIVEEDLKMLQDYGSASDPSLFEVPPLGPHYARQWGVEDVEEEATGLHHDNNIMASSRAEAEAMLQDGIFQTRTCGSCGPLTQKLIAAFIEDSASDDPQVRQSSSSSLPPLSPLCLETKLREELISLGLLDPNEPQKEISTSDKEDEIARELEKAQQELRQVIESNRQQKQMLHSLARAEMRRQEVRKKLQETDSELMDTLRRFASYRQRKKREPISRKDREMAESTLETRQRLISQLLV